MAVEAVSSEVTPARQRVVLIYLPEGLVPSPEPVALNPNDTVAFELGTGPADGSIRVTWEDGGCFSRATFETGDGLGDIKVTGPLPTAGISYKCELLVRGVVQAQAGKASGGIGKPGRT